MPVSSHEKPLLTDSTKLPDAPEPLLLWRTWVRPGSSLVGGKEPSMPWKVFQNWPSIWSLGAFIITFALAQSHDSSVLLSPADQRNTRRAD